MKKAFTLTVLILSVLFSAACGRDTEGQPPLVAAPAETATPAPTPSPTAAPTVTPIPTPESGYDDAVSFAAVVQGYADYGHFTFSGVQNYKYHAGSDYGEFQVTMTRGAVTLIATLRSYPAEGDCMPETLDWYESEQLMASYAFGRSDSEGWNHLEKTIIDVTDHYGNGTAGQSMQG